MKKVLTKKFFNRHALKVAKDLVGKYLVWRGQAYMVTEVEAYVGPHDKACHAYKGRTGRTEVMFCEAGTLYIYLIYGMYNMLNIVTGEKEYPAAVLIRSVKGIEGPGRLTKKIGIPRELNGMTVGKKSGLWFEDRGYKGKVQSTPRIGIAYAEEWKDKPYRFILKEKEQD